MQVSIVTKIGDNGVITDRASFGKNGAVAGLAGSYPRHIPGNDVVHHLQRVGAAHVDLL